MNTIYIIHGKPGSGKTVNADAFQRCFQTTHIIEEGIRPPELPNSGDVLLLTQPGGKVIGWNGLLNQRWVKRVPEHFTVRAFCIEDAASLCRERGILVNYPVVLPRAGAMADVAAPKPFEHFLLHKAENSSNMDAS